jgi:hypothetical protein
MVATSFPKRCIDTLAKALASYRLPPIEFVAVQGRHEKYWYAKAVQKDLLVELYVYMDEAGCALNKAGWKIFEKWDFSDNNDLIRAFVAYVINVLTVGPGTKDDCRKWGALNPGFKSG